MAEILKLETRKKIYKIIQENPGVNLTKISEILSPGVNLTKISEILSLSPQLVDYHLKYLEHHELISIEVEKGYKRCYIIGQIGAEDKQFLSVLRQETPLKIVQFLLKNPNSKYSDIFKNINISSPLFSYHLKKLIKNGIVEISESNGNKNYVLINEKKIMKFLIRYKQTSIAKRVKDTWEDFGPG